MYTQIPKTAFSLLSLAFCFSLCACSTTSETFDCPAGKGVGCKSVSEINQMIDQGTLLGAPVAANTALSDSIIPDARVSDSRVSGLGTSDEISVQRIPEEHLRVWIAPFQDTQGNLHEGSIIHTVLKPASWRVLRPQEPGTRSHELGEQPDNIEASGLATSDSQSPESKEYP